MRLHLLSSHGIDLDNPAMCVVEEKRYTREDEDLPSCSNLDMSGSSASCSPAHTPSSRYGLHYIPIIPHDPLLIPTTSFLTKIVLDSTHFFPLLLQTPSVTQSLLSHNLPMLLTSPIH